MTASGDAAKRATIYFEPVLHHAIRLKSAHTHRSVSDVAWQAMGEVEAARLMVLAVRIGHAGEVYRNA